ncbi:Zn(II)2Cys6 transcription factor [Aspergillus saccharolyticus JOP 1030-1]|uniref:Beta-glucosidase n=1 Tax=Aspergillus saccharolyticus JOP 1030-1 TaxID=1450539 RepID=A0A318ZX26_9EURO|nr:beta-glucosidase [Aspergillus saccharolyticus JOP 1030-1]PYH44688.1 beta-glucosidase [Aspergillus saccharolyticus JOP 1030-1]
MLQNAPVRPYPKRIDISSKACDLCRKRKVKCELPSLSSPTDPTAARCARCERLNQPCTFIVPCKTRGPKKRSQTHPSDSGHPPLANDNHPDANATPPNSVTDDLCSRSLFQRIMQDYLEHIYPLVPIVHRPSFQDCLRRGRHEHDSGFLALTVAIAALVVATLPSKFQDYRTATPPLRFTTRRAMVRYCYEKNLALRTSYYFDEISFQKFAASFLLFAAFLQLGDHNRARMLDVEAMQFARLLNLHAVSAYEGLNCIETQLRKKGFWLVFYGFVHTQLQNMLGERLSYLDPVQLQAINPEDLMPVEVDDELIFENEVLMPAVPTPCLVTGFKIHSRVFWAAIRSPYSHAHPNQVSIEPCACVRAQDANVRVAYLRDRLQCMRNLLHNVPPSLRREAPDVSGLQESSTLQSSFESMRVNIHVTHLWLQSLLIDHLEAAQGADPRALWRERAELCRQLFFLLYNVPDHNLEINGLHLAYKVRDIAAGMLTCPYSANEPEAESAAEYIRRATEILSRLDSSESVNTMNLQAWVDTDRIRTT